MIDDENIEGIKDDESSNEQSEETKESALESTLELVKGLQKGYTQTRQDMARDRQELSEIRENLSEIANAMNKQSGAQSGEDEYVTVGKLREIISSTISSQAHEQESRKRDAEKYIENTLYSLRSDGVVSSKEEEEELIKYALDIEETNLLKASKSWKKIKEAEDKGKKEASKITVKREEGSKVGTSSKSGEKEEGISYQQVHNTDWYQF